MIAGDIQIERAIVGTGDIVLFVMLLLMILAPLGILVSQSIARRIREEEREGMIIDAQLTSIGKGVTLLGGIRAYFGVNGNWSVPGDGTVCVMTAFSGYPKASLRVYPQTGQIDVYAFRREPDGGDESDILLQTLVQAARAQETSPRT